MPRRRIPPKHPIVPDARYASKDVATLVERMMLRGKKSVGYDIMYQAMDIIKEKLSRDPLEVFNKALENVKPVVEVKSRRVGGSTYQVPTEVRSSRSQALSIRWIISFAMGRGEKSMAAKLAGEFMDAASGRGAAVKKKEDTHKMAEANKAFAHYRW